DDGRGLAAGPSRQPGCGLGLTGMAERAAALGGELRVGARAGGGTCLLVRLPEPALSASTLAAPAPHSSDSSDSSNSSHSSHSSHSMHSTQSTLSRFSAPVAHPVPEDLS
ncbi:MAG TPA: hypothetical protein VFY24_12610, partial [Azospira sp.]|nr:hypothetical protein [Azospira sp.]